MSLSFRHWVTVGFAIACGIALFVGAGLTVVSISSSVQEASRRAEAEVSRREWHTWEQKRDIAKLTTLLENYHQAMSRYPTETEGLMALCSCPTGPSQFYCQHNGRAYVLQAPTLLCADRFKNVWGHPLYVYRSLSNGTYTLAASERLE